MDPTSALAVIELVKDILMITGLSTLVTVETIADDKEISLDIQLKLKVPINKNKGVFPNLLNTPKV